MTDPPPRSPRTHPPRLSQGQRPEHLADAARAADPADDFVAVFDDDAAPAGALEAKLRELCTYLLAFEERGEVFGRTSDRRIVECLAKRLAAWTKANGYGRSREEGEGGGEKKPRANDGGSEAKASGPGNNPGPPPRRRGGRGRGRRAAPPPEEEQEQPCGGANGEAGSEAGGAGSGTTGGDEKAAASRKSVGGGDATVVELLCRALWTYEEVTELHAEEGHGPMLTESPLAALVSVVRPPRLLGGDGASGSGSVGGGGGAFRLDPGRRLAAEEAVKLLMLLGQVRRSGASSSGHIGHRRAFPSSSGLGVRRLIARFDGFDALERYVFACHEGGHAAAAADGLALVRGVCECVMAAPPPALAKALCRLARDDAAIALREDALRCLASLFASCAAREGAVLVLLDAGLADAVAGALGGGKREGAAEPNAAEADAREPDATDAGPGSPPSGTGPPRRRSNAVRTSGSNGSSAIAGVVDVASRLAVWLFSPRLPNAARRCSREGFLLDVLSDPATLVRACGGGSAASASSASMFPQAIERALRHAFEAEEEEEEERKEKGKGKAAPGVRGGGASGASGARAAAGAEGAGPSGADHLGLRVDDRVRDGHFGGEGHVLELLPNGRCLVEWSGDEDGEAWEYSDEDDRGEAGEYSDEDDLDGADRFRHASVVHAYRLHLLGGDAARCATSGARHPRARASEGPSEGPSSDGGGRGASGGGGASGVPEGSLGGAGIGALGSLFGSVADEASAAFPGARDFWIAPSGGGSSSSEVSGATAALESAAAEAARREREEPKKASSRAARRFAARRFAARLFPALLAAHRASTRESTRRELLRLVAASLEVRIKDEGRAAVAAALAREDLDAAFATLGEALAENVSPALAAAALTVAAQLVRVDAGNARAMRRRGILRRVERLARGGGRVALGR